MITDEMLNMFIYEANEYKLNRFSMCPNLWNDRIIALADEVKLQSIIIKMQDNTLKFYAADAFTSKSNNDCDNDECGHGMRARECQEQVRKLL